MGTRNCRAPHMAAVTHMAAAQHTVPQSVALSRQGQRVPVDALRILILRHPQAPPGQRPGSNILKARSTQHKTTQRPRQSRSCGRMQPGHQKLTRGRLPRSEPLPVHFRGRQGSKRTDSGKSARQTHARHEHTAHTRHGGHRLHP